MLDFDKYEVLTFDCYGTLIDWENGILSALKPILSAHNIQFPDDQILEHYASLESDAEKGEFKNYKTILKRVVQDFGQKFNFVPSQNELHALPESIKNWQPFPDTIQALSSLKKKYKLTIISNVDDDLFAFSAKHLKVDFDWVFTAEQSRSYKPSLNNFNQAIGGMGLPKEKILHVAQSLFHDIVPAKSLGLSTVWVNRRKTKAGYGATPPAEAQPDLEVHDLQTLVEMIGLD